MLSMFHVCAIQAGSGSVVCWGDDFLGKATPPSSVNGTLGTATAISTGGGHGCAIQASSDAVVCWGFDRDGQATAPESVDGTAGKASAISAGDSHTLAIVMPVPEPASSLLGVVAVGALLVFARSRANGWRDCGGTRSAFGNWPCR